MKEKLEQDLAAMKQARHEGMFDTENPARAQLNYHRCDAVVNYIETLLQVIEDKEKENE